MRVQFAGIPQPIQLDGCAGLLDRVAALSQGWRWRETDDPQDAVIAITRLAGGWRIASRWTPEPAVYDDETDIVCALFADLMLAHVAAHDRLLCLHAGAVAIGSSTDAPLFVFPAESQAGKSTLTAALAVSGGRLYSDDVLPVDLAAGASGQAMAIGLAPRPRLPLPNALPLALREMLSRRLLLANPRHGYVALPRERLAPLGERRPIAAFVRLERAPGHASLAATPRSEIMTLLLRQNFGATPPATELVERFAALTAAARCWRLRYSDIGEAVALLTAQAQSAAAQRRLSA
ncbi:MAG: hypothetical protein ACK4NA_03725 [Alphaproteobacteria bacterium]